MHQSLQLTGEIPTLADPILIAAFWGWSDNTGSAMGTIRYLRDAWNSTEVATVDPDRFYDLTVSRPRQFRGDGGPPRIRWPGTRFHIARPPGSTRDVVLLAGREPSLRWREYSQLVAEFMQDIGARQFLTLGSRPASVPHTRPSPVVLGDADEELRALFDREAEESRYQGPTGIQTVIVHHLRSLGLQAARVSALVPAYLTVGPSPHAMIALIQELDRGLHAGTDLETVHEEITPFELQVEGSISQLPDPGQMRDEIRRMEQLYDSTPREDRGDVEPTALPSADELVRGIEDLLRGRRNGGDAEVG